MSVDAKIMTVVQAIKHAIVTSNTPGLSVNAHPNPFMLGVIGTIDLQKIAERVLLNLEQYAESVKLRFEADVIALRAKIVAEAKLGAVSVEDALARIKAKAGGELLAAEGVLEAAVGAVKNVFVPQKADAETAASAVEGH